MQTKVLLSIKPRFADAILDGTKIFEFRRTVFRNAAVRRIVIYASRPVCLVIGEFQIEKVFALEPKNLWKVTADGGGIDQEFFDAYFRGCKVGFALKVRRPKRYTNPLPLTEHYGIQRPPQSFCYLRVEDPAERVGKRKVAC